MDCDDPELWAPLVEWAKTACEELANWGRQLGDPPPAFRRRAKAHAIEPPRRYAPDPLPRRDPQGFPYSDSLFRAADQFPKSRDVIIGHVVSG